MAHSSKGAWFQHYAGRNYEVRNWFQAFAFGHNFNLCRYGVVTDRTELKWGDDVARIEVGLCTLNQVEP
jgi:hypothetical protein